MHLKFLSVRMMEIQISLESLYANQQKWVKGSSIQEANKNLQKFLKSEGFSIDFDSCINNKEIERFCFKRSNRWS